MPTLTRTEVPHLPQLEPKDLAEQHLPSFIFKKSDLFIGHHTLTDIEMPHTLQLEPKDLAEKHLHRNASFA